MITYFGDFAEDDTVNIPFNTFDSNDPSASVTITNLVDADIMVHKDGGLAQIVTDGASVIIDFDSITGNHLITIDTSVHADYAVGSEYQVRIEGTTVDGATINAWVGSFSIERAGGALALLKLIQAAVITNAAGADIAADIIAAKADTAAILVDTAEIGAAGAGLTALATQASLDTVDGIVDAILIDTGTTLDTKLDDIQGATFNTSTDSLEALRNRGDAAWTGSAVTSNSGTAQAGSASTITLAAGASASDDTYNHQIIYINGGTGVGQSRVITDYVGATKVATIGPGNWGTNPDATSTYDVYPDGADVIVVPSAADIADSVWDEPTVGHTVAGSFGEQCKNDIDAILTDTIGIATVDANVDAILLDTATLGAPAGADFAADIAAIKAETVGIATVDTNVDTINTNVAALNDVSAAQVNAEVLDVMNVDTFGEPGQGAPGATISMFAKINYLYKAWRNKSEETATEFKLYDDAGTVVDQKAPVSDNGTVAVKSEVITGP